MNSNEKKETELLTKGRFPMAQVEQKAKNLKEVEEIISKAIKKVGGRKENDLCKYLPMDSGGYMHHFTLRKMKHKQPLELSTLIEKFIIRSDRPSVVSPKQRAPRGSRKRPHQISLSRGLLDRVLQMARMTGDKEIVSMLSPKKSLAAVKRELIATIRHERVEQELWNSYVDCVNSQHSSMKDN